MSEATEFTKELRDAAFGFTSFAGYNKSGEEAPRTCEVPMCKMLHRVANVIDTQAAELEKLKKFARKVIDNVCWNGYVLDGGDVQEFAEKLGLIKQTTVTEEFDDFEVGDIVYKFTEILAE